MSWSWGDVCVCGEEASETPVVTPTPIVAAVTSSSPEYVDHAEIAINRLAEQFKEKISAS